MATVLSASPGEPRRKSGLFCTLRLTLVSALVVLSVLLLSGCGGTSPRFRTGEKKVSASGSEKKANSSKSVSESADEEDREKKADDAEKVLAGTRSFKTEKNSALSNLDQAKMMREISKMMGVRYKLGGDDQNRVGYRRVGKRTDPRAKMQRQKRP